MRITNRDMYHGAALTQIAEHAQFTAINPAILEDNRRSESAFVINNGVVIYLKYNTVESGTYIFNFDQNNREEVESLNQLHPGRVFIALVCVDAEEICCITHEEWVELLQIAQGNRRELRYETLYVHLQPRQRIRVSMRGTRDDPILVPRNRFPDFLFREEH